MKFNDHGTRMSKESVAPFAGAWIEIISACNTHRVRRVAPFAGAWIEIDMPIMEITNGMSLPSRERGLKSKKCKRIVTDDLSLPSRERGLKLKNGFH